MLSLGVSTFLSIAIAGVFSSVPTSTNFTLKNFDLGSGGGGSSSSSNYNLDAEAGGQGGDAMSSTNYGINTGEVVTQNSNVPAAPSLSNPSNEYSRLFLTINPSDNPSDTKFAIAISSDDFVTTNFVKSDNSIGSTLLLTDYQTYAAWGGGSGFWITGLSSNTTYKVKVKAMQGNFTESAYSPATAGIATVLPSISFGVATNPPAGPPYSISFTSLTAGVVQDSASDAALTLSTNALAGGEIFIRDSNSGLTSASASYTIPSATADLSVASSGYGAVVSSVGQTSGGPMTSLSPFNGAGNNVGALTTSLQKIASSSAPVTGGSVNVKFKAKTTSIMPAATDYEDTLTFIASMSY
jgi:hypothetical protein